ncbi:MAG: glutaredoxin family protein [Candidatus Verstraetearchaeota archaeon]|nr:glutaredoxin family protein [Candidatus Verstraetearchaeota archaeon]
MNIVKVPGSDRRHKVFVYALSTCAWCKKTKRFLEEHNIEFEYVDVDRCTQEEMAEIMGELERRKVPMSLPLIIIDEKIQITGFKEDQLKEALGV